MIPKFVYITILFFSLLQINPLKLSAQNTGETLNENSTLDSLFENLDKAGIDTSRVNILNLISWHLTPPNPGKGILFADSARKLSIQLAWKKGEAEALNNTGEALRFKGDLRQSIEKHKSALKIFEEMKNRSGIANTLSKIGIAYFNISDFPKSLDHFDRALKIYRAINEKSGIANNLSYIGNLYGTLNKHKKALEYFNESLIILNELKDRSNIAILFGNIGLIYKEQKNYVLAISNYEKALNMFKEMGDDYNYSLYLGNLGEVYSDQHDYSKALNFYKKSLKYFSEIKDENGIAYQYGNIGNLYYELSIDSTKAFTQQSRTESLNKSISYLVKAVEKFKYLDCKDEQKNFLFSLSKAYEEKGDLKDAFDAYRQARELQDTIFSADNKKMISELEIKRELDLREKEIEILNNEKEYEELFRKYLIAFLVFLGIIFFAVLFFYFKIRKDNRILQENISIRQEAELALTMNEAELKKHRDHLEKLVQDRTRELETEISERIRAEEALKKSEEKSRMLLELAVDAFFQGDRKGNLITVNNKATEITGYSKDELMGMNIRDLFPKEVLKEKPLQYALLKQGETITVERKLQRKDGLLLHIEMNSREMPDGTFQSFFRDMTEREKAKEELEKQKTFFEQMYVQSATSTQILDADGWCLRINPKLSELFGVKASDIEGRVYNIFNDAEIKKQGIDILLKKVIRERTTANWEVCFDIGAAAESQNIEIKEKKKVWFANKAYPIIDSQGNLIHVIIQHENITERKRAEEELVLAKERAEAVSKAKTVFLANMSHELRTPLVGILGYSELLSKELNNPEQREMAEGVNRTGVRLLNTLSMVLDLTRVESDRYEIQIKPIDVINIVRNIYNNFKGAVSRKSLKFNLALHTESYILNIDTEMLKVILDNLINNAIKFTNRGAINISTGIENNKSKSFFFIKVTDTGIGMNTEDMALIFEEFRQLSEGTTKDYPGTGLGLSITKRYVELLNGEISVESKLGVGSAFTVKFGV